MKLVCSQCGAHYEQGKFCLECGSPLREVQVKKVLYCNTCQIEVATGKFCPECGTKLEEREIIEGVETVVLPQDNIVDVEDTIDVVEISDDYVENILSKYRNEWGDIRTLNQEEYAVAAAELQECVAKGNAEAMCFLADLYMDGHGVPKDENVAYNLLKQAEGLGSQYAKAILAIFYVYGVIVQQDLDEALNRLTTGYDNLQNPQIAGILAYIYYNMGDYKSALKYATESAEKNEKWGLTVLGGIYLDGHGVEVDEAKAFDCYMQAASMGDEMALTQLGMMYVEGRGVEQDPTQGYFWLNESAQKGHNEGMYALAFCYKEGFGVEQDVEKAAEWFKKSAEAGYVDAMLELANYYQESLIDYDKAKYWLNQAAEQGNAEAMNQLGVMYSDIVDNNPKEAIKWYKKAIALNQPNAYRNLALCYRDGTGVKKDLKKAEELLQKAIELGVEGANLIKITTPSAKMSNFKFVPNCKQDNELGVEFIFDLNVDGMLGNKVNISAVDTNECTRKSVLNKPCKRLYDPIECVWCKQLKPKSETAIWKSYKVFVPYHMLSQLANLKTTIVFTIWNQSEKQPVKLLSEEFPYELTCTKHLFRADEWHFVQLKK